MDRIIADNQRGCSIVVAHRLTTIRNCDKIIFMDKGCKMEEGSHDELMAIPVKKEVRNGKEVMVSGWYHDLWTTQMGKEEEEKQSSTELRAEITRLHAEVEHLRATGDSKETVAGWANGPQPDSEPGSECAEVAESPVGA